VADRIATIFFPFSSGMKSNHGGRLELKFAAEHLPRLWLQEAFLSGRQLTCTLSAVIIDLLLFGCSLTDRALP
jgi:hypothetical protein